MITSGVDLDMHRIEQDLLAELLDAFGMVAEKSSDWRSSGLVDDLRTSREKPMSSMRSASSRTRNATLSSLTLRC